VCCLRYSIYLSSACMISLVSVFWGRRASGGFGQRCFMVLFWQRAGQLICWCSWQTPCGAFFAFDVVCLHCLFSRRVARCLFMQQQAVQCVFIAVQCKAAVAVYACCIRLLRSSRCLYVCIASTTSCVRLDCRLVQPLRTVLREQRSLFYLLSPGDATHAILFV
jgi:hypothetical protein